MIVPRWSILAGGIFLGIAHQAHSQSVLQIQQLALEKPTVTRQHQAPEAEKTVTLTVSDASVRHVVRTIISESRMAVRYQPDVIPAKATVSVRWKDVRAIDALREVLQGTGVQMNVDQYGAVTLFRKATETTQATDGVITGKVVHAETRQPVVGATVMLDGGDKKVLTDADGTFRIAAAPGEQQVRVRMVGFSSAEATVVVTNDETVSVEIVLTPTASVLNEVIVTGTVVATARKEIPTPITVITAKDIEQRNITRVEQLFRGAVPGVVALDLGNQIYAGHSTNGDSLGMMATAQVYARGSASLNGQSNPLKTYVDGVELMDPSYLGTIDPSMIDRIEIITGPQAATIYGANAMGGVMQIFTKKGFSNNNFQTKLALKYGIVEANVTPGLTPSHNHTLSVSGGSGPVLSYAGNISYRYQGQWRPGLWNRSVGASLSATHTRGAMTISGGLAMTKGGNGVTYGSTGNISTALSRRDLTESGKWEVSAYGKMPQRKGKSNSQTLSLNADYRPFESWQHHVTLGRNQTTFELLPEGPPSYNSVGYMPDTLVKFTSQTGQRITMGYNTTILPPRTGLLSTTLTLGANSGFSTRTSSVGCAVSVDANDLTPCMPPVYAGGPIRVSRNHEKQHWGGFGSVRIGLFDQLYVTLGLRGESNPNYGRDHTVDWTPTNGVAYTVEYGDVTVKLLGSYGRVTRPPEPDMREQIVSSNPRYNPVDYIRQFEAPELTPEYSKGPQGGIEIYYGNRGSLTVNHFSQEVTNLIQFALIDSVHRTYIPSGRMSWADQYQYQNIARIKQLGWDGTLSLNLQSLTVSGTYSWADSRILEVDNTAWGSSRYVVGQSFTNLPTHTGNLTVSYALRGTSVTLVTNFIGAAPRRFSLNSQLDLDKRYSRIPTYTPRRGSWPSQYASPGYAKTDVSATHRMNPWMTATLNIMNATDSYDTDNGALYPTVGRQTFVGLSLRYP